MKNKSLFLLMILFTILSSCASIHDWMIEDGRFVAIEKKVHDTLAENKAAADKYGDTANATYNKDESIRNYKDIKEIYDKLKKNHNEILSSVSKKIKKQEEVKYDDFSTQFEAANQAKKELKTAIENISGIGMKDIPLDIIIDIAELVGKKIFYNVFAKSYEDRFKIIEMKEIVIKE